MTARFRKRSIHVYFSCTLCGEIIFPSEEHIVLENVRICSHGEEIVRNFSFHPECFTKNIIHNLSSTESQQDG